MGETYPRVYKYGPGSIATTWVLSLIFIGGAVACAIFADQWAPHAPWLMRGICVLIGLFGLIVLLSLTCRLTLYEDRFEYKGLIAVRRVAKADVLRTQNVKKKTVTTTLVVVLKDGRRVEISDFGRMDDTFAEWFDAFPNAETMARNVRADALMANPAFGGNPAEREHHINTDVEWINFIGWPCSGLVLWAMIWPHPYQVCLPILLTMPILGLVATFASRGRWTMLEGENRGRLSIGIRLFIGPALIVALRAFLDDDVIDWVVPAAWSAAAGIGLAGLNGLIERKVGRAGAIGMVFLWGVYAWGGLLYVDTTLDPSPGRAFPVHVLGKNEDSLTVTAWGARTSGNDIKVTGAFARKVREGDTVCVYVYPGRLNWPWYQVGHCPPGT